MVQLKVGNEAPNFTLKDVDGNDFELYRNLNAETPTVVTFFRGAW